MLKLSDAKALKAHILIVGGEPALYTALQSILCARGYAVAVATNGTEALALMLREEFELVILGAQLPGGLSGLDLIPYAQLDQPHAAIIFLAQEAAAPQASADLYPFAVIGQAAGPAAIADMAAAVLGQRAQVG